MDFFNRSKLIENEENKKVKEKIIEWFTSEEKIQLLINNSVSNYGACKS